MTKRLLSSEKIKQEKVVTARGRLAGALTHVKNIKVETEDEDSQDVISKPSIPTRGRPKGASKNSSSNQSKSAAAQIAALQQASYVMKLFDRSVNLAKFDEETSLYPICRAWMKNSPRVKLDGNVKKPIVKIGEDEIHEMPRIVFDEAIDGEDENMEKNPVPRCPPPEVNILQRELLDGLDYKKPTETKESLLKLHQKRWSDTKTKFTAQSKKFEERYFAENLKLIESLQSPPKIQLPTKDVA